MFYLKRFFFLLALLINVPVQANIVGTDLQNFNPTSNGLDFVTVHSSDTLDPALINFGAFLSYTTNSLPFFTINGAPTNQNFTEPNDRLLYTDVHLGFGLTQGWDVGVSAGFINDQQIDSSANLGSFSEVGLTDVRLNTKVRIHKGESTGLALIASADFDRVRNNPYIGDNADPTFNGEIAFDAYLSTKWRWGLNAGYRLRNPGNTIPLTGILPLKDQITYSTALSYFMESMNGNIIFEIFGSNPIEDTPTPTDRDVGNLEALLGLRLNVHKRLDLHFGGGTEIYHGLGTPDIRGYAGFNWRLGPLWGGLKDRDEDGILDDQDRCPDTPPSERDQVNEYGCSDSDGDGVFNDLDQCPGTPQGTEVDEKGCAVVMAVNNDLDGDGVPNDKDQCPDTLPGTPVNDIGCDFKRVKDIVLSDVNFYTGTANMTRESQGAFQSIISQLKENKDTIEKIIVEGHTDDRGSNEYNMSLSHQRANTVRDLIIRNAQFSNDKVEAAGFGEEKPVADNATQAGQLRNRRVELRVIRTSESTNNPAPQTPAQPDALPDKAQ